ncbi:MAG: hypothetical protein HZC11_03060 [Nitrospirae bacterium]|nr:hypothetical protein [Nitrospirota bacterium]
MFWLTDLMLLWLGFIFCTSVLFIIIYFIAMRMVYFSEELKYKDVSTRAIVINYIINAIVVVIAAIFLPKIGEGIEQR